MQTHNELRNNIIERIENYEDGTSEYLGYIPGSGYYNKFDVNQLLPFKNDPYASIYIQMKRNIEDYIVDKHLLVVVDSTGGSEGEGDYVERIIGAYPIYNVANEEYWINVNEAKFFKLNGFYASYDGVTWDSPHDIVEVKPKLVQVIKYE